MEDRTTDKIKFNKSRTVSKKNLRKRSIEESTSEDETTVERNAIRKRAGLKVIVASKINDDAVIISYKSNGSDRPTGPFNQGATACLETETESHKDARSVFERSLKIKSELKGKPDDKIYRGLSGYSNSYENKMCTLRPFYKGPTRAPSNIRTTCQWEFQPDICKDFKETGYCGFGDSCKFLHDRTDYKYGWEIEQACNKESEDKETIKYEVNSSDEDESCDLPFKCYICRNSFVSPVVTKCYHYFCEKCALSNFKKNTHCFICNKQTNGIFKPAHKLIAKLKGGKSFSHDDTECNM